MSREARLRYDHKESWYHVFSRTGDDVKKKTLVKSGDLLIAVMKEYNQVFHCHVGAYSIVNDHYHMVVKVEKYKKLSQKVLEEKAAVLYADKPLRTKYWKKKEWDTFNKRLFDLTEFMRAIQMAFSRRHNKGANSSGNIWSERFKSTILSSDEAALDAILYVDTEHLRRKAGKSLTGYKFSSYGLQDSKGSWLLPLAGQLGLPKGKKGLDLYAKRAAFRMGVGAKVPAKFAKEEEKNNYTEGCFKEPLRFFIDGLIVGNEKEVRSIIDMLRAKGKYVRKAKPRPCSVGTYFTLREQRGHFAKYN